jgi:hypothetical protein
MLRPMTSPRARRAANIATVLFAGAAVFEVALALGAPLGHAAFGGTHRTLPPGLRVTSAFSAALFIAAIAIVRTRAGLRGVGASSIWARRATWGLAILFAVGVLMNLASQSSWERLLQAPIVLAMSICCAVVARENTAPSHS